LKWGKGIFKFADGAVYVGEFKEDKIEGHGEFVWPHNKKKYVGNWKNGKMNGNGVFTWDNGAKYEGHF
jgi:hypothetical protein